MKSRPIILLSIFLFSCTEKDIHNKSSQKVKSIAKSDLKLKPLHFLNSYDILNFTTISDSVLVLNIDLFQGWKTKSKSFRDTLKLREKLNIQDTLKNTTKQILSFSNKQDVFFQVIVDQSKYEDLSEEKNSKNLVLPPEEVDNYSGKIFINKSNFKYYSKDLFYK